MSDVLDPPVDDVVVDRAITWVTSLSRVVPRREHRAHHASRPSMSHAEKLAALQRLPRDVSVWVAADALGVHWSRVRQVAA